MTGPDPNADARAAVELGIKAATAYERPDLAERLQVILGRVQRPEVQIVAVGEFKQGKSSLVNSLVNVNVCPVDDDIATAVHTILRYGPEQKAFALVKPADDPEGEGVRQPIELKQIRQYATELGQVDPSVVVKAVEIELPRKLLEDGVIVVDTPGVGGLGSAHAAAGLGALSLADAALFISDASQEYTRAEMDFLAQAVELCDNVICVMTKIDLYPHWRDVLAINRGHLDRLGMGLTILPVSSVLRTEAINRKDKDLNQQSGFPQLVQYLTEDVVAANARSNRLTAQGDVLSVCDQVGAQFEAQKAALNDPEANAQLMVDLEQAKANAEVLRSQAAKWNTTLGDGITDLTSDIDFDLRARIRHIMAEADTAIEGFDPLISWDEFEPWLTNAVSQAVVANYRFLTERSSMLRLDVAAHFNTGESQLVSALDIHSAANVLERVSVDPSIDPEASGMGSKGLTAFRGSYSGFLMVSLLGGLIGLPAVAIPVVGIGAAALMGRKTLREEKERALAKRRMEAKNAVRRYCDEVSFQVSKDSRDTLRAVQRQLRDHYGRRAEELNKSTSEALKSASSAAKVAEADRAKQLRNVQAELDRIDGLRQRALNLAPIEAAP
jgi:GTPase SAR1 family protein/gas vesicle protein